MKTRLVFLFIFVAVFSFDWSSLYAQDPEEVPVVIPHPPGNHPHSPQPSPITCYLFSSTESLALSSNIISENALVLLENTTSGSNSIEEVYISSIPETIPLLGPGNYSITITMSSGAVYSGVFSYNNSQ